MEMSEKRKTKLGFTVEGMKCMHCAVKVKAACEGCSGVESAAVELEKKRVTVIGIGYDVAAVVEAIKEAGFEVSSFAECSVAE